ncbi:hypothetical protein KIH31_09845 [Paenarthrobacter sp. DKR-5]|uniref:hypothetical protein n=1 Tax=Paenarthrobacter sp. DKR-5 TaxID=2835535 RepID=UPI001BDC310C|nr:hypothetical protein [Paenarthrobacter sp. DKR-5]MBT1002908.1 hypothetical protein [Paenarthrobacter sp. DKR-5]
MAEPRQQAPTAPAPARGGTLNEKLWAAAASAAAAARRWPWWLQVSVLYFGTRIYGFGVFAVAALHQGASPWGAGKPDYWHFLQIWDSEWYSKIYQDGYPGTLPRGESGLVQENQWAFYPLFPLLARGLTAASGLGWAGASVLLAPAFGLAAALVAYRLFRRFASVSTSMWSMAFLLTFPVSPILQVPYAESLNLFLLASALLLLVRRRYLAAIPVVLLMCLSRPVGVPFAALAALSVLLRFRARARDPFPPAEMARAAAFVAASAAGAVAWPVIAWAATGEPKAYTDTEAAWRGGQLVPLRPWLDASLNFFGPVAGWFFLALLAAAVALYLNSKAVRRLGTDLRLWSACYLGYLALFLYPQTSTFRLLLPLFPLALAAAFVSRSRAYRSAVVVMFLLLQIVWVDWLWVWTQLPGGGDWPP